MLPSASECFSNVFRMPSNAFEKNAASLLYMIYMIPLCAVFAFVTVSRESIGEGLRKSVTSWRQRINQREHSGSAAPVPGKVEDSS